MAQPMIDDMRETTRQWWLPLVVGIAWIIFGFIVLTPDITTVWAVAVFAGIGFIFGGILELFTSAVVDSWKWLHILFGVIAIIAGIMALVWPGQTFLILAAIIGWYMLFAGVFDIMGAFISKGENELWWLSLILGIIQILLGFWAIGYVGRSVALLVVFVGATALARGISNIFLAFGLRKAGKELKKVEDRMRKPAVA